MSFVRPNGRATETGLDCTGYDMMGLGPCIARGNGPMNRLVFHNSAVISTGIALSVSCAHLLQEPCDCESARSPAAGIVSSSATIPISFQMTVARYRPGLYELRITSRTYRDWIRENVRVRTGSLVRK